MKKFDTNMLYISPVQLQPGSERRLGFHIKKSLTPQSMLELDKKTSKSFNNNNNSNSNSNKNNDSNIKTNIIKTYIGNNDNSKLQVIHQNSVMSTAKSDDGSSINDMSTSKYYARKLNAMYRTKVMDAYYNRHIFSVYGVNNILRRELLQRGWLEKLVPGRYDELKNLDDEMLTRFAKEGNDYESVAISKIIGDLPAFFVWQFRRQPNLYAEVQPYRNVIRRNRNLDFTTKIGLIGCAEQEHWYCESGVCSMCYPRFYRLGLNDEDRDAFIEDFHHTQCYSLLRFIQDRIKKPSDLIDQNKGTIALALFKQAVGMVKKWLDEKDDTMTESEWNDFITESNEIIRNGAKFKTSFREFNDFIKINANLWRKLETTCFNNTWDGCRNIWILKPGYLCRGCGIIVRDSLNAILDFTKTYSARRYIAQKYIERPFLIYDTKFDIRQYMLLCVHSSAIHIWLYGDCYLKFSSQIYNLSDLSESIHLTNNSVQKNYQNDKNRDEHLPAKNMWSLTQFKNYLQMKGHQAEQTWKERIFNGFKQIIIAVVMASLEDTELVPNTYEMYGCDFMLDEALNPILIEINATPDLSPSTEVTAHLCPLVIKDLVRVIVDLPRDKLSSTGLFELVYSKKYHFNQNFDSNVDLNVDGRAMTLHPYPYRKTAKTSADRLYTTAYMAMSPTQNKLIKIMHKSSFDHDTVSTASKKIKKVKKFKDPSQAVLLRKIKKIHEGNETKQQHTKTKLKKKDK